MHYLLPVIGYARWISGELFYNITRYSELDQSDYREVISDSGGEIQIMAFCHQNRGRRESR